MCPSYHGHPRRGALHPRPGPAAVRDARRRRRRAITDGWRSEEVHEALDLCLACKGCKTRLPGERGHGDLQGRVPRPPLRGPAAAARAHYSMGWLPVWARLGRGRRPGRSNPLARTPGLGRLVKARRRDRPAPRACRSSPPQTLPAVVPGPSAHECAGAAARCCCGRTPSPTASTPASARPPSRFWRPPATRSGPADRTVCCGLTWISTGQLDVAPRVSAADHRHLRPHLRGRRAGGRPRTELHGGVPLRRAATCFPVTSTSSRLPQQTVTLAELLTPAHAGVVTRHGSTRRAIAQTHCHQHAVMGFDARHRAARRDGRRR